MMGFQVDHYTQFRGPQFSDVRISLVKHWRFREVVLVVGGMIDSFSIPRFYLFREKKNLF